MQDSTHVGPGLPTRRKKPAPLKPGDERHGTYYGYSTYGCRCDPCRDAVQDEHRQRADKARELIATAKNRPCTDCGGTFPLVCMDFDHRDPSTKLFTIAAGLQRSHASLLAEIAKCDVVCSNCHRVRTAVQNAAGLIRSGRPRRPVDLPRSTPTALPSKRQENARSIGASRHGHQEALWA